MVAYSCPNGSANSSFDENVFNIVDELDEVINEIMVYKWLESEKQGSDIGVRRATCEWIERHYDEWFRCNCHRFIKDH